MDRYSAVCTIADLYKVRIVNHISVGDSPSSKVVQRKLIHKANKPEDIFLNYTAQWPDNYARSTSEYKADASVELLALIRAPKRQEDNKPGAAATTLAELDEEEDYNHRMLFETVNDRRK